MYSVRVWMNTKWVSVNAYGKISILDNHIYPLSIGDALELQCQLFEVGISSEVIEGINNTTKVIRSTFKTEA